MPFDGIGLQATAPRRSETSWTNVAFGHGHLYLDPLRNTCAAASRTRGLQHTVASRQVCAYSGFNLLADGWSPQPHAARTGPRKPGIHLASDHVPLELGKCAGFNVEEHAAGRRRGVDSLPATGEYGGRACVRGRPSLRKPDRAQTANRSRVAAPDRPCRLAGDDTVTASGPSISATSGRRMLRRMPPHHMEQVHARLERTHHASCGQRVMRCSA